jgi:hypothetical protein
MAGHRWQFLLRPRWLAWHVFAVVATAGMLWLGDWQLHRAESGNELSWAYTIEWPLFAICGIYFWVRTIREELHEAGRSASSGETATTEPAGAPEPADAYLARLRSEVASTAGGQRGRRHGWR